MNLDKLHCIALDQPTLTGFRNFISCWLYRDERISFVVDPGPLSTIPVLLEQLQTEQIDTLDYILLTHIHIDHAGGTGELLKQFPEARVICHPRGIEHMIAPEKLWQGSRRVLGQLAETYGEIVAVPEQSISFEEHFGSGRLHSFLTPGHAQHHCCFQFDELLFGGEVVGVRSPVPDGIYMRPATPPKFILSIALDSIQRMIDLQPRYLVIGHYGMVEPAIQYLQIGRNQLKLWVKVVLEHIDLQGDDFRKAVVAQLLERDPYFSNIGQLEQDLRVREDYFLDNSLRGMREFALELNETERQALHTAA